MQKYRIWIGAAICLVLIVAMYVLNTLSMREKPPPDVELEGRLAQVMPEEEALETEEAAPEPSENAEEAASAEEEETQEAEEPASDEEKTITDKATGSVVKLETDKGDIYLDLYDDKTPVTTGSFLDLVGSGFYDGLTFHRVIPNFMIQGGDPKGDGSGGPGFTIPDEADKGLKHVRGSLSMAKTPTPNSGSTQFFVCHSPQAHLDGVHTVFGECIQGMDVVDKIQQGDNINKAVILKKSDLAEDNIKQAKEARVPD